MDSSSFVDVALEENEKSSTIDAKQELLIKSAAAQMYGGKLKISTLACSLAHCLISWCWDGQSLDR